jgi:hypothetical protein
MSPAAWLFWWNEMKCVFILTLRRHRPVVLDARRCGTALTRKFFEQCQSGASIVLDALGHMLGSVQVRDGGRGMAVRLAAFRTGASSASLAVSLALLTAAGAAAQTGASQPKPVTGFVSTYEIMRTVRSAGFDPLVPPLREGTSYVLRATDFRGILMRVVLDARTGAIRDVTRIVPATSGPMMPPSYGPPPAYGPPSYGSPSYGSPAEFGAPTGMGPGGAPGQLSQPAMPSATAPARPQFPPMPRTRPTEQASQKPDTVTGTSTPVAPPTGANSGANIGTGTTSATTTAAQAATKPATKSEATAAVPATSATATVPPATPAAPGKAAPAPPIND